MQLVRKLWTKDDVSYAGRYYRVAGSTVVPRIEPRDGRPHPTIYFGGASAAAEKVAAAEADVQLFWGEPLDGVQTRIERLRMLSDEVGREHAPLEFGLRVTTLVRDTTEQACPGVTHFLLSDTPCLREIRRQGDRLLPLLRE